MPLGHASLSLPPEPARPTLPQPRRRLLLPLGLVPVAAVLLGLGVTSLLRATLPHPALPHAAPPLARPAPAPTPARRPSASVALVVPGVCAAPAAARATPTPSPEPALVPAGPPPSPAPGEASGNAPGAPSDAPLPEPETPLRTGRMSDARAHELDLVPPPTHPPRLEEGLPPVPP